MKKFWKNANLSLKAGLIMTAFFFFIGFVVYFIPHTSPFAFNTYPKKLLPSAEHWLGTTSLGQDVLWLLIESIHNSLVIGLIVATIGTVVGVFVGLIAGFSGGMRQRVIIALATFMSPNVVLADEPTTALDVVVQRGILMMLMRLQRQFKNTLVLVSHDMGVHYQITNRMGIMYSGSFVELGKTDDIFNDPIHPYTQMLIGALPRVGDKSQKVGIPGRPPALKNPPPGCRFAPRCPKATDKCRELVPEFREIKPGRYAACHLLNPEVK